MPEPMSPHAGNAANPSGLRFVNVGLRTKSDAYLLLADDERHETVIPLTQAQLARLIAKAAAVLQDMDHEPREPSGESGDTNG